MKKLSYLALAAVGLLLGACSSDRDVDGSSQDPFKGREGGFIKVGINLPVQPQVSTRAWEEKETGTLAEGLTKEYNVKDCILLLFEGADEASATLKQVENVASWTTKLGDTPDQVTTYTTKTVHLLNAPSSNLYALAVVNGAGYIELVSNTTVSINGGAAKGSIKLSDLDNEIIHRGTKSFIDDDGNIFMTNAVLSTVRGGTVEPASATVHTLAPVDASRIYETEEEANKTTTAPSCDIYVERAVAKVTIDNTATDYLKVTALKNDDGSTVAAAKLTGWAIDNYNEASYLARRCRPAEFNAWSLLNFGAPAVDKYRFVGDNPVDGGHTDKVAGTGYRTYWCIDPNYDSDWSTGMFITASDAEYSNKVGDENPQYCFENTFDVAHQQHNLTTRVVFKVELNGGTDFYTIGVDKKTLYQLDDVKKKFAAALMGNSTFLAWWNTSETGKGGNTSTLTYDKITLTLDTKTYGVVELSKVKIDKSVLAGGADIEFDNASTVEGTYNLSGVISTINSTVGKVRKYTDGATYYQVRIKHFGDDLTPWNAGEYLTAPAESGIDDIYPNDARRNANYLGRYGMVRNNWYVLKIGEIGKIGSATVPEVNREKPGTPDPNDPEDPGHPDDELEDAYIKARINILSWAKRVQSWNLK